MPTTTKKQFTTYSPISSPPDSPSSFTTLSQFSPDFETPDIGLIIPHDNLPPLLHEILPKSYINTASNTSGSLTCSATFLTNIQSQDGATQWIRDFQEQTKTTYRITRGVQSKGVQDFPSLSAQEKTNKKDIKTTQQH